ncbi:MAG: hypothetical protein KJ621_19225 [Proteobacteria bacterium]|nr:hypothetical protein [Pseudomonadota bacterium]MBU1740732.1 hypothetical protein [Pseudomonadota bacterium]
MFDKFFKGCLLLLAVAILAAQLWSIWQQRKILKQTRYQVVNVQGPILRAPRPGDLHFHRKLYDTRTRKMVQPPQ